MPCVKLCKATCNEKKITFYFLYDSEDGVEKIGRYCAVCCKPKGMRAYVVVKIPSGINWEIGNFAEAFIDSKYCNDYFESKGLSTLTLVGKAGWLAICDSPVEIRGNRIISK